MSWVTILGFLLVTGGVFLLYRSRRSSDSGVVEVRRTPRREIEDLTVDEFRQLGTEYLTEHGYRLSGRDDDVIAHRQGVSRLVQFDPAAEGNDPRTLNQMIARIRRSDLQGGVLVTSGSVTGKARDLAEKADVLLLDPDELIGWRRSRDSHE